MGWMRLRLVLLRGFSDGRRWGDLTRPILQPEAVCTRSAAHPVRQVAEATDESMQRWGSCPVSGDIASVLGAGPRFDDLGFNFEVKSEDFAEEHASQSGGPRPLVLCFLGVASCCLPGIPGCLCETLVVGVVGRDDTATVAISHPQPSKPGRTTTHLLPDLAARIHDAGLPSVHVGWDVRQLRQQDPFQEALVATRSHQQLTATLTAAAQTLQRHLRHPRFDRPPKLLSPAARR